MRSNTESKKVTLNSFDTYILDGTNLIHGLCALETLSHSTKCFLLYDSEAVGMQLEHILLYSHEK